MQGVLFIVTCFLALQSIFFHQECSAQEFASTCQPPCFRHFESTCCDSANGTQGSNQKTWEVETYNSSKEWIGVEGINVTCAGDEITIRWEPFDSSSIEKKWDCYFLKITADTKSSCNYFAAKNSHSLTIKQGTGFDPLQVLVQIYPLPKRSYAQTRSTTIYSQNCTAPPDKSTSTASSPSSTNTVPQATWIGVSIGTGTALLLCAAAAYSFKRWWRSREDQFVHSGESGPEELQLVSTDSLQQADDDTNHNHKYVASYYPESTDHIDQIASILNRLRQDGYDIIMDRMDTPAVTSMGLMNWVENRFLKAEKVLVFYSPGYAKLYAESACSVTPNRLTTDTERPWYEITVIRSIYLRYRSSSKMIFIKLAPDISPQDLPPWVEELYSWPGDFERILLRMNDFPDIAASRVGVANS